MNRRETHIVEKIDTDRARTLQRSRMREVALDLVATAMREVIDPEDRQDLARELCTVASMNAAQACGHTEVATHLSSLAGQAFTAGQRIRLKNLKGRGC